MPHVELTLMIGHYAMRWHLPDSMRSTLTETVQHWRDYAPKAVPVSHPSPRNNIWPKANPWFTQEVIPALRTRISGILASPIDACRYQFHESSKNPGYIFNLKNAVLRLRALPVWSPMPLTIIRDTIMSGGASRAILLLQNGTNFRLKKPYSRASSAC